MVNDPGRFKELLQRALDQIETLQERLTRAERARAEPVAVIGVGCRFPGDAATPARFWDLLSRGRDGVIEIPADRRAHWPDDPGPAPRAGLLRDVEGFDAAFMGIAPREARLLDPQQRLALEVVREALEDAAIPPARLAGTATGVFVGISWPDYLLTIAGHGTGTADAHALTGTMLSVTAGRIAHRLGLRGPALSIDTACSSSLVALHVALHSLRSGETSLAVAGGVNLLLAPWTTEALRKMRALSAGGRCRTFDAAADGYVRGEGAGFVVLKRLTDALSEGDDIRAVIRGSAVNHDGRSMGLTAPNHVAQSALLRAALDAAGLEPGDIGYVETHGTGTPLGDPIEVEALKSVLGAVREDGSACAIGSVKTNLGHLEAAAGVAGLIKVILALQHETIPRQLHFRSLNPDIDLTGTPLVVAAEDRPWPRGRTPRRAGVSAFGFAGTNAHVIVEEAPEPGHIPGYDPPSFLLPLSARTPGALRDLCGRYAELLEPDPGLPLRDICHTAGAGRDHFEERLAIAVPAGPEARDRLRDGLRAIAAGAPAAATGPWTARGGHGPAAAPAVVLSFGGDARYAGAVLGLRRRRVVAAALERCDELLGPLNGGPRLMSVLDPACPPGVLADPAYAAPALFAVQWASWELWRSFGLTPRALLGDGVGAVTAACAAGMLPLGDALRLVAHGGAGHRPPPAAVGEPSVPVMSRGRVLTRADLELWPGPPADGSRTGEPAGLPPGLDADIVVELGPVPESERPGDGRTPWSPTLVEGRDDEALVRSVGELYAAGAALDWSGVNGGRRRHGLPTYPFQHERYWAEPAARPAPPATAGSATLPRDAADPDTTLTTVAPSLRLGRIPGPGREAHFIAETDAERLPYLRDHRVFGDLVVPGAHLAAVLLAAGRALGGDRPCEVTDLVLLRPLIAGEPRTVHVVGAPGAAPGKAGPGDLDMTVRVATEAGPGEWTTHATARLAIGRAGGDGAVAALMDRRGTPLAPAGLYDACASRGIEYGPAFRWIESAWRLRDTDDEVLAGLRAPAGLEDGPQHAGLLDAGLQILLAAAGAPEGRAFLPFGIDRIAVHSPVPGGVWCHARVRERGTDVVTGDVRLLTADGQSCAELHGVRFKSVPAGHRSGSGTDRAPVPEKPRREDLCYEPVWIREASSAVPAADDARRRIVVAAPRDPVGRALAGRSAAGGGRCVQVVPGDRLAGLGTDRYMVDPFDPASFTGLLDELGDGLPADVVYLAGDLEDTDAAGGAAPGTGHAALAGLLHLTQALARRRGVTFTLCVVTRGAQDVTGGEPARPAAAMLWGLARVIQAELPDLRCRVIDLGAGPAAPDPVPATAEICDRPAGGATSACALRGTVRYVQRLERRPRPARRDGVPPRADATYLITGGFGELGLRTARMLVQGGARHLVLLGRNPPGARARAELARFEAAGVRVWARRADVSVREEIAGVLAEAGSGLPSLRGVVHCAGVLDDGVLLEQRWRRFERVLAPKAAGAWHLHELTRDRELDFFVLFSSVAALIGSPGQGNYAAANAYLDGLAACRRAAGLPATDIQWGPWAGGMADRRHGRARALWRERGFADLDPSAAIDVLSSALGPSSGRMTVLDLDPDAFARTAPPGAAALMAGLLSPAEAAPARAAGPPAAPGDLARLVREETGRALGFPGEVGDGRPLHEIGLDSLMAVELRNGLAAATGLPLPATLVYDHPTIAEITAFLREELERAASHPAPGPVPGPDPAPPGEPVAGGVPAAPAGGPAAGGGPAAPAADHEPPVTARPAGPSPARTAEWPAGEPIAIVGMACRYPGGVASPEDLWRLVAGRGDAITEVPATRWDVDAYYDPDPDAAGKSATRWGGFVAGVESFDAAFFGISPGEARMLDPQQRLLLEVSWEALERAGHSPDTLMRSPTGVFVGLMSNDYAERLIRSGEPLDAWYGTGNLASVAAGRLSYVFGTRGPAITVDTACSSSLVTLHLACQSLRRGECDLALAGGATLVLTPTLDIYFSRMRGLAADGRCKSFDDAADGIVWSDGCGMLVLRRLSDARRDGDHILAVVRGTAVNQDGRSQGISAPNGSAQQEVIRGALADARLTPADIDYVEAHGTGTPLGDPIEVQALGAVFGAGRSEDRPLWTGSVKSNLGHTQAAAGVANIIKVVMALREGTIPPSLHFERGNRHIAWDRVPVRVVTEPLPWARSLRVRRAGVSSFGISGTNAHAVIEEPPAVPPPAVPDGTRPRAVHLLALSARSDEALRTLAARYADHLAAHPELDPADLCRTANAGRAHHEHRLAVIGASTWEFQRALREPVAVTGQGAKAGWVFPGAWHAGMGRELYDAEPVFRAAIDRCAAMSADIGGPPLLAAFQGDGTGPGQEPEVAPVALFGVQMALAALWRAYGMAPVAVLGYGAGEPAAACAAGVLTVGEGLRVAVARARSGGAAPPPEGFRPRPPDVPIVSARTGRVAGDELSDGAYWWTAGSEPARLPEGMTALAGLGCELVVEFGPAMAAPGAEPPAGVDRIACLSPGRGDLRVLLEALGAWYTRGGTVDWPAVHRAAPGRRVPLPTYPFERVRHWAESAEDRTGTGTAAVAGAAAPRAGDRDRLLHDVVWRPDGAAAPRPTGETAGRWLIVSAAGGEDGTAGGVASALRATGAECVLARFGTGGLRRPAEGVFEVEPLRPDAFAELLHAAGPVRGVVYLAARPGAEPWRPAVRGPAELVIERLETVVAAGLHLSRALIGAADPPGLLWMVTGGGQSVVPGEGAEPDQAALWGLARTVAHEHPELGCRLLDHDPHAPDHGRIAAQLAREDDETQIAIRGGSRYAARLVPRGRDLAGAGTAAGGAPSVPSPTGSYRLEISERGRLDTLELRAHPRERPGHGQVEIEVEASGLNFRDVLTALGMYPGEAGPFGYECAGRVAACGPGVTGLAEGDAVIALTSGGMARYVTVDARLVARSPAGLDQTAVATLPMAFVTAWYALFDLGGLRAGQRVLVHSAAGGVGMTAVQLARRAGAQVLATASPGKRDAVRALGVEHVWNSRTLEFGRGVDELTGGHGVDVVLNSLTGEFVDESLALLAAGGRFVELGKTDVRDGDSIGALPAGATYRAFDLREAGPERLGAILREIAALVERGELRPLPRHVVDLTGAVSAFRQMAQAGHIGKIVLRAPGAPALGADGSYLVTGGLGGLGLAAAEWLAGRGARHLVLAGRRPPGPGASEVLRALRDRGVRVSVRQADLSRRADVAALISELPRLRGVVHCAGVLDDGVLAEQTVERFRRVLSPKVLGAVYLDELTRDRALDLFVTYSSVAGVLGSAGQANYAAANAALDALAERRRAAGLPGLSVAFGPFARVGMAAAQAGRGERLARRGMRGMTVAEGHEALGILLGEGRSHGVVVDLDLAAWARAHPGPAAVPFLSELVTARPAGGRPGRAPEGAAARGPAGERIAAPAATEAGVRRGALVAEVHDRVAHILGRTGRLDVRRPLRDLGVDSLTAVELRNVIGAAFGVPMPATLVFDHPTIEKIADYLRTVLPLDDQAGGRPGDQADDQPDDEADDQGAGLGGTARDAGDARSGPPARDPIRAEPLAAAPLPRPVAAPRPPAAPEPSAPGLRPESGRASEATPHDGAAEPIAVIGMGCRFPGGVRNPDDLWALLREGRDAITEVPPERWDVDAYYDPDPEAPGRMYTRWGGFIADADRFDAAFFGISPREAMMTDPQHRLLLEVSWEAIERAGLAPDSLAETSTGVFAGLCLSEYGRRLAYADPAAIDAYTTTGAAPSVAAGRLAYTLGARGPVMSVDTACSSSLVALDLAAQHLRTGACDLALAGGVGLQLAPETTMSFCRLRVLSPTGRCRAFDASADGYVRGDGCGVVVLKRLRDARRDGDPVLAVIRGVGVNHDGRSNGMTAPNAAAQVEVLRRALRAAGVEPGRVGYVEAHGTGTKLGDPIEVQALGTVYGADRDLRDPLLLGSIKTNIGHTEGAAGMAGLIKLIMALRHGEIPASLHLREPSPYVPWEELPIEVVTELRPWPGHGAPRVGAVSSFGISGTNAHVIVEQGTAEAVAEPPDPRPDHLLAMSADGEDALADLATRWAGWLAERPETELAAVARTTTLGRAHRRDRLAIVASSAEEAVTGLRERAANPDAGGRRDLNGPGTEVALLFTGQGSQYAGMGQALMRTQPVFRAAMERCARILGPLAGDRDLLALVYDEPGASGVLDETSVTQPALFAVEWALWEVWRSWGLRPAAVLGHSVGEYVAACVSGAMAVEDGLRLVALRGRLMGALPRDGAMASVMTGAARVEALVARTPDEIAIAGYNGPGQVVVSGRRERVRELCAELAAENVTTMPIAVSHAFHSPLMEPMLAELESAAAGIAFSDPGIPLISNVTGRPMERGALTAGYWGRHARQAVRFTEGMRALESLGVTTHVELGPHPVLSGLGRACVEGDAVFVPALRRGHDDWRVTLEGLARLYEAGLDVDWAGFHRPYPARRRVIGPTYPFRRTRHWLDAPARPASPPSGPPSGPAPDETAGPRRTGDGAVIHIDSAVGTASHPYLAEHSVHGRTVVPAAFFLSAALAAVHEAGEWPGEVRLTGFAMARPLVLDGERRLRTTLRPRDGALDIEMVSFTAAAGGEPVAHARATAERAGGTGAEPAAAAPAEPAAVSLSELRARCDDTIPADVLYRGLAAAGLVYGPAFRGITVLHRGTDEALARLSAAARPAPVPPPALLDACFQAVFPWTAGDQRDPHAWIPVGADTVRWARPSGTVEWAHVRRVERGDALGVFDVRILDSSGAATMEITGLRFVRGSAGGLVRASADAPDRSLSPAGSPAYEITWLERPKPAGAAATPPGRWLVIADATDRTADAVLRRLVEYGAHCHRAAVAPAGYGLVDGRHQVDLTDPAAVRALVGAAGSYALRGVLYFPPETPDEAVPEQAEPLLAGALHLTQALAEAGGPPLTLVTRAAQATERVRPAHAPLWGFAATAQIEHPDIGCRIVDLGEGAAAEVDALAGEVLTVPAGTPGARQVALRGGARLVPRAVRVSPAAHATERPAGRERTILITGGLGGLGLLIARGLAGRGERRLVLAGRGAPGPAAARAIDELRAAGTDVRAARMDVTKRDDLGAVLAEIDAGPHPLGGVIHLAGVLDDGLLRGQTRRRYQDVLAPKVAGAWNLHELTSGSPLEFFVLISSATAVIGWPGQSGYGAANAFLDGLARLRVARGLPALSLAFGPWTGVGMGARMDERGLRRLAEIGHTAVDAATGEAVLDEIWARRPQGHLVVLPAGQAARRSGVPPDVLADAEDHAGAGPSTGAGPRDDDVVAVRAVDRESLPEAVDRESLPEAVDRAVRQALRLGSDADLARPLHEFGLDSVTALEVSNALARRIRRPLPATLLYDHPTVAAICEHLAGLLPVAPAVEDGPAQGAARPADRRPAPETEPPGGLGPAAAPDAGPADAGPAGAAGPVRAVPAGDRAAAAAAAAAAGGAGGADGTSRRLDVAITGVAARFPGAAGLEEFWRVLAEGRDCVTEIPAGRWAHDRYFDPDPESAGRAYSKWGGFLPDIDVFDPLFFSISPRDAELMDPQERLFLETAWAALEDAGYSSAALRRCGIEPADAGVFAGVMWNEYQLYATQESRLGRMPLPISSHWSIANRVSHALDFQGPSLAVDTACSSSLSAFHLACESIRSGDCKIAIAGGVNLSVHPYKYLALSQGRFVSTDGRCRSFGAGGDGYVPGEGVGAVVLRPLADAERDGDHIYGVIKGSAVNHGGRVSGYAVPSANAQAAVVRKALRRAGVAPDTIGYVEAHGTGTALGDPIEIAGLTQVFAEVMPEFLPIGSVKSNIGHLEAAAGVAALAKVLLQFRHETIAPSLHGTPPNPHIDFAATPFRLVDAPMEWPRRAAGGSGTMAPRRAAISSFGAGGANAHLVVEEYIDRRTHGAASADEEIIILSARDDDRLREQARRLRDHIGRDDGHPAGLADLAYTLQTGREPMAARLAITARDMDDLCGRLDAFLRGAETGRVHAGGGRRSPLPHWSQPEDRTYLSHLYASGRRDRVAAYWAAGAEIDWADLADSGGRRRLSLPTYPFARERYWVPAPAAPGSSAGARQDHTPSGAPVPVPDTAGPGPLRCMAWRWRPAPAGGSPEPVTGRALAVLYDAATSPGVRKALARVTADPALLIQVSTTPHRGDGAAETGPVLDRDDADAGALLARGLLARPGGLDGVVDACGLAQAGRVESAIDHGRVGFYQGLLADRGSQSLTLLHLTAGVEDGRSLAGAAMGGLVAALAAEYQGLVARTVDLPDTEPGELAGLIEAELRHRGTLAERRVRYRAGTRQAPVPEEVPLRSGPPIDPDRCYVITGGTRGLGAAFARMLVERGARRIALLGARPLPPRERWAALPPEHPDRTKVRAILELEERGATVLVHTGPVRDRAALDGFFQEVRRRLGPIGGVLHCAGAVSRESPAFVHKTRAGMAQVLDPKIDGTEALAAVLEPDEPDFFVLFSSVSAAVPDLAVGLSDYAAANAYLDRFAVFQQRRGRTRFRSVNWPSFRDAGSGAVTSPAYRRTGLGTLTAEEGFALLDGILGVPDTPVLLPYAAPGPIDPALLAGGFPRRAGTPPVPSPPVPSPPAARPPAVRNGHGTVRTTVAEIISRQLKLPPGRLRGDVPFADYGADSVLVASAVTKLEEVFGAPIDPAVLFEYPTLDTLADHLAGRVSVTTPAVRGAGAGAGEHPPGTGPAATPGEGDLRAVTARSEPSSPRRSAPRRSAEPIAVIGIGCRFPGGPGKEEFWEMLAGGRCAVREVPASRFDAGLLYSPVPAPGRTVSRWGGFLDGIDMFDPEYFGIDGTSAAQLDPLQRIMLETALSAVLDAGYRREELAGRRVGVYVGARSGGYADRIDRPDRETIVGIGQNFIAARISDFFDWHGTNLVVDTACSSSLVSVHLACQALRTGEADAAVAGGVDLLLDERVYLTLSAAGALSPDGLSRTFDERANGFVPGEGSGAVVLKRLDDALADGDRVVAVIRGSAVGNDGRTMGITTPNMAAQADVVAAALEGAGVPAADLSYVEAHGTGTMIGDPIELKALASVFRRDTGARGFCAVGSVKTNIGHLLSAAGIAGLIKTALSVERGILLPTLHCDRPNPRFAFEESPFYVAREAASWRPASGVRRAGVSAFGFGGTNCHLIIEEPPSGHVPRRAPIPEPDLRRRRLMLPEPDRRPAAAPHAPAGDEPLLRLEPLR